MRDNQKGEGAILLIILTVVLVASLAFGAWAFMSRSDYKNNVDKKIAVAVAEANASQKNTLTQQFDEIQKRPYKRYQSAEAYGSISFSYPKTWSAYIDTTNSGKPINGYFYPQEVPGVSANPAYALRVELYTRSFNDLVDDYDSLVKNGTVVSHPYRATNIKGSPLGVRLDGAVNLSDKNQTGSLIIVSVRDKTLKLYSESRSFLNDFNKIVLPSFSFNP